MAEVKLPTVVGEKYTYTGNRKVIVPKYGEVDFETISLPVADHIHALGTCKKLAVKQPKAPEVPTAKKG